MNATDAPDSGATWDSRYASRRGKSIPIDSDPWLERWSTLLNTARQEKILELGCGSGRDTRFLTGLGYAVIATDYSRPALETCRQNAPLANIRLLDIREPLPFGDDQFPVIVASLCLHYFPWTQTMGILSEIRRCLAPGGFLLSRVNSTGDIHYGAVGHPEIEPGLYRVDGELKRFFDQETMKRLIKIDKWKVHNLEELTVQRYDSPKVVWEAVLEKT